MTDNHDFCFSNSSCFNGGTCMDGINSFTCLCPAGFTGNYCQHDINECDSRPCMNGGTCQDSYGTYKCTCPQGYHGLNCQVTNHRYGQKCSMHPSYIPCFHSVTLAAFTWTLIECNKVLLFYVTTLNFIQIVGEGVNVNT